MDSEQPPTLTLPPAVVYDDLRVVVGIAAGPLEARAGTVVQQLEAQPSIGSRRLTLRSTS